VWRRRLERLARCGTPSIYSVTVAG
jgi:hypothetical protein